jgi:hypothetical protein
VNGQPAETGAVIPSEASNLSFFYFPDSKIEERFLASLGITEQNVFSSFVIL